MLSLHLYTRRNSSPNFTHNFILLHDINARGVLDTRISNMKNLKDSLWSIFWVVQRCNSCTQFGTLNKKVPLKKAVIDAMYNGHVNLVEEEEEELSLKSFHQIAAPSSPPISLSPDATPIISIKSHHQSSTRI